MTKYSFEDFLKEWHMKNYHGTDDDAPDAFEHWLSELETQQLLQFGELYGKEMYLKGMKHVEALINKPILI